MQEKVEKKCIFHAKHGFLYTMCYASTCISEVFRTFVVVMNTDFLNIKGRLFSLENPVVMAILNATPDSFVPSTRLADEDAVLRAAERALEDGAAILDIGGYSTRPGAPEVSPEEEWRRVKMASSAIQRTFPDAIMSVDTFRAGVARRAVEETGVAIINDISGGQLDPNMFETVADLQVPYILMHMRGTPATMQTLTDYDDLLSEMIDFFQSRLDTLSRMGVKDVILDPGFGFSKTVEQNYLLLSRMQELAVLQRPVLAGLSRKSMLYKVLGITQEESLNATTAVNMLALERGAKILRVHDTKAAMETVTIYNQLQQNG